MSFSAVCEPECKVGQGFCASPRKCVCYEGFTGKHCIEQESGELQLRQVIDCSIAVHVMCTFDVCDFCTMMSNTWIGMERICSSKLHLHPSALDIC